MIETIATLIGYGVMAAGTAVAVACLFCAMVDFARKKLGFFPHLIDYWLHRKQYKHWKKSQKQDA